MSTAKKTAALVLCLLSALSFTACTQISARTPDFDYGNIKKIPLEEFLMEMENETEKEPNSTVAAREIFPKEEKRETEETTVITENKEQSITEETTENLPEETAPVFTSDPDKIYDGDQFLTDYFTKEEIDYLHNCVFVGDSTCLGLKNYGLLNAEQVIAIPGAAARNIMEVTVTSEGEEISPITAAKNTKLNEIYCLMGLNDVNLISPEDYKNYYEEFLGELKKSCPKAQIHILSVSPVTEASNFCYNSKLDMLNEKLREISEEKGIDYVDISSVLKNENGCMIDEYAMQDGIHFRLKAYYRILEYIINTQM